jgi:hypothetical protein
VAFLLYTLSTLDTSTATAYGGVSPRRGYTPPPWIDFQVDKVSKVPNRNLSNPLVALAAGIRDPTEAGFAPGSNVRMQEHHISRRSTFCFGMRNDNYPSTNNHGRRWFTEFDTTKHSNTPFFRRGAVDEIKG